MKRLSVFAAMVVLAAFLHLGCSSNTQTDCSGIRGDYNVNKNITSVSCYGVTIQNSATVIPSTSALNINQTVCELAATEDISVQSFQIPYTGSIDQDDQFTLEIENPDALAIPLQLSIEGVGSIGCKFNGSINWDGKKQSSASLSGQITESLNKRSDETNPACPSSCTLQMSFEAAK